MAYHPDTFFIAFFYSHLSSAIMLCTYTYAWDNVCFRKIIYYSSIINEPVGKKNFMLK